MNLWSFFAAARVRARQALGLAAAALAFQTANGAPPRVAFRHWDLSYPNVTGERLNAACWGDPGCVAVGDHGEILFSPDGSKWSRMKSPVQRSVLAQSTFLRDICYGNGAFVAVGGENSKNRGRVFRSFDGLAWAEIPVDGAEGFRSIAFGGGLFTAVTGKQVLTSTDGSLWEKRADASIQHIAYGRGKWVGSTDRGLLYYTTDFASWKSKGPPFGDGPAITNLTYANDKFIAVGGWNQGSGTGGSVVEWSDDGMFWSEGTVTGPDGAWGILKGCAGADGRFAMVGSDSGYSPYGFLSFSSRDGKAWSASHVSNFVSTPNGSLSDIAAANGRPFIAIASTGQIWKSKDGASWQILDPVPLEYIEKVVHAHGTFVAVGGRRSYIGEASGSAMILSSPDGLDWDPFIPARTDLLSAAAFGNGLWVVTGDNGAILTSRDAHAWTERSIAQTADDLSVLVYGAGRFVAFAGNRDRIYWSTDGIKWRVENGVPVNEVNAAAFINGEFIAVGNHGLVSYSKDGLTWESQSLSEMDDLGSICYGNGTYAADAFDRMATSVNGRNWEWHAKEPAPHGISFLKGWFLSRDFRFSEDGVTWSRAKSDFQKFSGMSSIVFGPDYFVGVEGLEIWKGKLELPKKKGSSTFSGR